MFIKDFSHLKLKEKIIIKETKDRAKQRQQNQREDVKKKIKQQKRICSQHSISETCKYLEDDEKLEVHFPLDGY